MSMNRDNFRAAQPPSKVLHVRNLAPEATEADVAELCRPFGRVLRVKLTDKYQGFAEFDNIRNAIAMMTYFVGNPDPPRVCEKPVFLQYSTRQEIGGGVAIAAAHGAGGGPPQLGAGPVLLASLDCSDASLGPGIDSLHTMFSSYGEVSRIALSRTPAGGLQALVQFSDPRLAAEARAGLDGTRVPAYMAPSHPNSITMRVGHSMLPEVTIARESEWARDYTQINALRAAEAAAVAEEAAAAAQVQAAALPADGEGCCVLLAMIDDVQYTPSLDTVKQVFSVYGPLAKMQLLYRAGAWQALVQYAEPAAAAAARSYLNGHAMYPGGANKLTLEFSMQRELCVPQDDEWGWDWTRQAEPAAAGGAGATEPAADAQLAASPPGAAGATGGIATAAVLESVVTTGEEFLAAHEETRDNEHLQRETQLLKAFLDRAQRQQQQQLDAGVLADAHGKAQRRTTPARSRPQEAFQPLSDEEKGELVAMEVEALEAEINSEHAANEKDIDDIRTLTEEVEMRIGEIKRTTYEFKREIILAVDDAHGGTISADKVVRHWEEAIHAKEVLLEKVALKNSTYKAAVAKLEAQLAHKEEMGEMLHLVDFEQLQIENQQHMEMIDAKNKELLQLKLTTGKTVQALNAAKAELTRLESDQCAVSGEISSRRQELAAFERNLTQTKAQAAAVEQVYRHLEAEHHDA